ncbi:uncharacterized protein LOC118199829 [Stegodyphus dumicola]|uniref:uncharacterized protein LOC118199829 n=1 Tax=Stegodyphus dumicola TaxID=202533 RepID=UPI0015B1F7CC|nr:uncharacterized protein LOC118199829 [Stegodyphus dumicola]
MCKTLKYQPNFLLYLWNRLQNYPSSAKVLKSCDKIVKMNLFEQEYVNVFAEPICLLLLHKENFMCTLSELHEKDVNLWQDQLRLFIRDVISELLDVQSVLSSIDDEKLNQGFTYHHQVFLALKKLYCQVKVLESQICFLIGDNVLISSVKDMVDKWLYIERRLPAIICWFIHKL